MREREPIPSRRRVGRSASHRFVAPPSHTLWVCSVVAPRAARVSTARLGPEIDSRSLRRLAVALAAAWAAAAGAEPVAHPWSIQARAARADVRLGEPFAYELEISHAPAESYALPAELALGPFEAEAPR